MFKFKFDIAEALRNRGITPYTCRTSGLISQSTFTLINKGEVPALKSLGILCDIFKCQPGDLIEWIPDETNSGGK